MHPVILWIIGLILLYVLNLWMTREDITRDDTGALYLRRFFLWKGGRGKPRLLLHRFSRGDEDPHLHDHPWSFTSLILTRGYYEETLDIVSTGGQYIQVYEAEGERRRRAFYPRFSILQRPAEWRHRVILKDNKPVWTLVWTGGKTRDWGFWIKGTMCIWNHYKQGICWCGANEVSCDVGPTKMS
jgi:hypothetical protein